MRSAVLAVALSLLPLAASAQPVSEPAGPDTYLQVHLGAFLPRGDFDDLDTGYTLGGVFGARFTRYLAVEGELSYDRATRTGATLSDVPISVSLVARLPFKQAELAAYAGPDLHLVRLSVDGAPSRAWNETAFGGHYGVRAAFNVWPTTLIGLDARGTVAEAKFGGASARIDAVRIALALQYRF